MESRIVYQGYDRIREHIYGKKITLDEARNRAKAHASIEGEVSCEIVFSRQLVIECYGPGSTRSAFLIYPIKRGIQPDHHFFTEDPRTKAVVQYCWNT